MNSISISNILSVSRTCFRANVSSKKKVLELIANTVANEFSHIQSNDVFDALIERERLGSTGIGHGCAVPHCRLASTDTVIGVLILLNEPINYDSLDKMPVDIIFAIIVPEECEEEHLQLLAQVAEKFSQSDFRDKLRNADQREALFETAIH